MFDYDYYYNSNDPDIVENMLISPNTTPSVSVSDPVTAVTAFVFSSLAVLIICSIVAASILTLIGRWKIFKKAGEEGWKALVPIYSDYICFRFLNMEPLLCLLNFVPGASFVLGIVKQVKISQAFGKGTAFALGLIFFTPIFEMILGFGSAKFHKLPSSR